MNYLKFRTSASGNHVPQGVNLDDIILIKNGDPGNPLTLTIYSAGYDVDGDGVIDGYVHPGFVYVFSFII